MENDLLNDIEKTTPTKFKLNWVGVYFVSGGICIIWKTVDIIIYLIHLI
jgi:hypothetical protein